MIIYYDDYGKLRSPVWGNTIHICWKNEAHSEFIFNGQFNYCPLQPINMDVTQSCSDCKIKHPQNRCILLIYCDKLSSHDNLLTL